MAAFFLDVDPHAGIGRWVQRRGHSVMSARDTLPSFGPATDREILLAAARSGLILLTHNERDFVTLHNLGEMAHSGILTVPQVGREEVAVVARDIHDFLISHGTLRDELWRYDRTSGWVP